MKTFNAKTLHLSMKYSHIAISHNPFRIEHKLIEIQFIDNAHRSITASNTHYCVNIRIVEILLHDSWFQPHGFGPTRFLRHDLVEFIAKTLRPKDFDFDRDNDMMFFSEIYYAGGTVTRDISAGDLADDLLLKGCEAIYIENRDECAKKMVECAQPGDTILLMGARDPSLEKYAQSVQKLLEAK
mgnify:CR=1 FL=1